MTFEVNKQVFDVDDMALEEKTKLYKKWHDSGCKIKCLCKDENNSYPIMHVKLRNNKYFISNNSSTKGLHDSSCKYNRIYTKNLATKGIKFEEDTEQFICNIDFSNKKKNSGGDINEATSIDPSSRTITRGSYTDKYHRLYWLFLVLLEFSNIHEYKPGGQRNIVGRIYRALKHTKVNKKLLSDITYLLDSTKVDKNPAPSHQLIVAWGDKERAPVCQSDFFVNIPLFALDNTSQHVTDFKIKRSVYESGILFEHLNVNTGYWLIWKEAAPNSLWPKEVQIIFVPAEEITHIPVESGYENEMVNFLYQQNVHFKKPLVSNLNELDIELRPDMIVYGDRGAITIIEVAGFDNEKYKKRLAEKREIYKKKGYRYLEWNGIDLLDDWAKQSCF